MFKEQRFSNFIFNLRGSLVVAEKDARIYYLKPPVIIFGILFPVFFFLAFSLGRQVQTHILVPALVSMTLFFTSSSVGPLVTPWERGARTYERLLSTPVSLFAILLGDVLAGLVFGIVISFAPLLIGIIFFHTSILHSAIFLVGMVLSSLCFSSLGVLLSSPATEAPSQVMMLSALIRFPLIFISGIFIPLENLPSWGKAVSSVSPLTYSADLIRYSLYGLEFYPVFLNIIALLAFSIAFFTFAVKLHRKNLIKAL
ncbi:ABC transporter permease [Candidatus Aerophobetes bacterium]|nr:ABC transporter permease [Candidatus Aerophobetes bacterium]